MQGFFLIFTMNITYPDLPISRRRNDILAAMREHQVIVVVGETGSGKTTQLPKMAMELAGEVRGRVGCTKPQKAGCCFRFPPSGGGIELRPGRFGGLPGAL